MIGPLNPLPFRVGGGPSEVSRAYGLLRAAVGTGGSADDDRGIEGLWRRSRARGVAASGAAYRRAMLQGFPHLATDSLPYYERCLGIVPELGTPEQTRRARVRREWIARVSAIIPNVLAGLQAIDARFSVLSGYNGHHTQSGRTMSALDPGGAEPPFGAWVGHSQYPAHGEGFILRVLLAVGYSGPLQSGDAGKLDEAKELLRRVLPGWQSWAIVTEVGFVCGSSALGLAGVVDP